MPIFKKRKGVDVLDLTELQKKGLLKVHVDKVNIGAKVNSQGYVEIGEGGLVGGQEQATDTAGGVGALGFLDSLASSSSSKESSEQESYFGEAPSGALDLEIQGLKNKIEDLEYKIRVLEDKISRIGG